MSEVSEQLAGALNEITTSMVTDADSADVLRLVVEGCARLFGTAATGLLVNRPGGGIEVVAASDDATRFLELLQAHTDRGPCVDCIHTAHTVAVPDLAADGAERWPEFAEAALDHGFTSVHALPLRLNGRAFGGLNLFHTAATALTPAQLQLAQSLTDLAVLALTTEQGVRRDARLAETTLTVLNDRVHLAQAVGMVAGALAVSPAVARAGLRQHASREGLTVRQIAQAITSGKISPTVVATAGVQHSEG